MCGPYINKGELVEQWEKASRAITGYHVHIYFGDNREGYDQALEIAGSLQTLMPEAVGFTSETGAVGPHAKPNIAFEIAKESFGEVVAWLHQNSKGLSILIHPETGNLMKDHLESGVWIGKQQGLKESFFRPRPPKAA